MECVEVGESSFDRAFAKLLGVEGGYSNDKVDRGGKTRYGITEAVARANGYMGDMKALPIEWAQRIYKSQYWDVLKLDQIALMSFSIAEELFDTGVNMGTGVAAKFLQTALNAFNRDGQDYGYLAVDGALGPLTVYTLRQFLDLRKAEGEKVMLRALNAQQGARYLEIIRNDQEQSRFAFGWFLQRIA